MALLDWVQGARYSSPLITWYQDGTTTPETLTGATMTGTITTGLGTSRVVRAITGTLTVTDGANGVFRWDLSAADVADMGDLEVQFTATFASGQTPGITFIAKWHVARRNVVSV